MAGLGDDPRLQPGIQKIMEGMGNLPALRAMVVTLTREHPGASPDELGALAEKRVARITEGPVFDRAFNLAFDGFTKRPEIAAVLDSFGEKLAKNPKMTRFLSATIERHLDESRWRDRLVALNGGAVPDRRHAADLIGGHMFSVERLSRWYAKLYLLPTTRREVAAGVARLLEAPAFRRLTAELVLALVNDPEFQQRTIDAMGVLLAENPPTDQQLQHAIGRILDAPAVSSGLASYMKAVLADPQLGVIGAGMLDAITSAPDVRATFTELADAT